MSCTQLTGAQVITMAPNRPVAERVDILVEDDSIAEMADHIDCPPAETVDLPGASRTCSYSMKSVLANSVTPPSVNRCSGGNTARPQGSE